MVKRSANQNTAWVGWAEQKVKAKLHRRRDNLFLQRGSPKRPCLPALCDSPYVVFFFQTMQHTSFNGCSVLFWYFVATNWIEAMRKWRKTLIMFFFLSRTHLLHLGLWSVLKQRFLELDDIQATRLEREGKLLALHRIVPHQRRKLAAY